jgi:hypothetical protein
MLQPPSGGHIEFLISTDLSPYGMSLYSAKFVPNMKTNVLFFINNEGLRSMCNEINDLEKYEI